MTSFGMPTLIEIPDTEKAAELCRTLGLSFIELNMSFPQYQLACLDAKRLHELSGRYNISFTIHMDESLDVCNVNAEIAEVYTRSALGAIALAREAGIPVLNMHLLRGIVVTLPDRKRYIYGENERQYLDSLCRFRDAATAAIGDSGVKICVENTDGYTEPFLLHGLDALLESPAFALTFDIGHDEAIGNADMPLILERGDRLRHMHIHDAAGSRVHLALGDGALELGDYLELADAHSCTAVLETKTVDALTRSVSWLREHRRQGG